MMCYEKLHKYVKYATTLDAVHNWNLNIYLTSRQHSLLVLALSAIVSEQPI